MVLKVENFSLGDYDLNTTELIVFCYDYKLISHNANSIQI